MKRLALVCFCMFLLIGCEPSGYLKPKPDVDVNIEITVPRHRGCVPNLDNQCCPTVEEVAGRYHLRRRTGRFFRRVV